VHRPAVRATHRPVRDASRRLADATGATGTGVSRNGLNPNGFRYGIVVGAGRHNVVSPRTSYAWPWRRSAYRRADPATTAPDGTRVPAVRGVRLHGLRAYVRPRCSLSAGVHFMQVSKWLGHSSFVLTLSTYADYIREDATAAPNFARPVALPTEAADNVVSLDRTRVNTVDRPAARLDSSFVVVGEEPGL
jgi:hypothetical protein